MVEIVLNEDQVNQLAQSTDSVVLVDEHGRTLGYVSCGFSPDEIREAERRLDSDGPWYTTDQVFEYLRSLEQGA